MKKYVLLISLVFLSYFSHSQNNCIGSLSIILNPPPPVGGYAPGTTVDICITVNNYAQLSAEWFHGVGINFGPGWDISTINTTPSPSCDGTGVWQWFNSCTSTGTGVIWGPGFYYDTPQGSPTGTLDGIPGNNYGDNCQNFSWNFCLTIQTNPNAAVNIPLTGNITITSDGNSGSWGSQGCGVYYATFNSLLGGNTCSAAFFYTPPAVQNIPVNFINASTGVNNTFAWNFGDGQSSTVEHPAHTYLSSGIFPVWLFVTDATGCADSLSVNLNVVNNYWQGNYPYSISGIVFYDTDSNGVQDVYEPGMQSQELLLQPANVNTFSQQGGNYNFPVNAGDFIISKIPIPDWTLTSDSSLFHVHIDNLTGSQGGYNFGFKPNQLYSQMEVNLFEGNSSCLWTTQQIIDVENTGTKFLNGVISYVKHDSVAVISSTPLPDSTIQNVYYWHYSHLAPFQHEQISITVDKPNTIGFTFATIAHADVRDSLNNILITHADTAYEVVTCSYDPNEKTVNPVTAVMGQNYTLIGQTLTYNITFQNTGNAPAQNVTVVDTLPSSLLVNSFNLVMSSHPVDVHYSQDGILIFNFYGINLPDSVSNEPGSHGFVIFTIEAIPAIPNNTLVQNTASIYFDQNAPIQTPTASTTFVLNYPIGVSEINSKDNDVFIYPNPTNGLVTLMTKTMPAKGDNVTLFDNTGKLIFNQPLQIIKTIDLSGNASGIYTIKIVQEKKVSIFKLVLE